MDAHWWVIRSIFNGKPRLITFALLTLYYESDKTPV